VKWREGCFCSSDLDGLFSMRTRIADERGRMADYLSSFSIVPVDCIAFNATRRRVTEGGCRKIHSLMKN
jgi:hypothetical protein